MNKSITKEIWSILRRFRNKCITEPLCKDLFIRTGRLDIIIKHDDIKFLHDDGSTQSMRCYVYDVEGKLIKPVWISIGMKLTDLLISIPEGYDAAFNLTRSIDYDYDLMSVVSRPVITQYGKIFRFTLGPDMKRYLYPADSLKLLQIPEDILEYLKRIDDSYTKKISAILSIYMREDRPYIRLYSGAGIQICDGNFEGMKNSIADFLKITKSWSDNIDKIIGLYYKKGISLNQMYIVLSGNFKGLSNSHKEVNNEYTMILY